MSVSPSDTASRLRARIAERERVLEAFLTAEQQTIARVCFDMARAFSQGGSLIVNGTGPAASDAAHVAVEFMHPVIVGKRALPAIALSNDPSRASHLRLPRPGDIALGLAHSGTDGDVEGWLSRQGQAGCLTIALGGAAPPGERPTLQHAVDHTLTVPSSDPIVVQEVQETAYHVLWELVHVFFEHPGLIADTCITCGDVAVPGRVVALDDDVATVDTHGQREEVAVELIEEPRIGDVLLCHAGMALQKLPDESTSGAEPTGFLYPFLESEEVDLDSMLADVRASTLQKGSDVSALRAAIDVGSIDRCAGAIRERLERGGRLLTFGNGGSSTDAQDLAADALFHGWPAIALTNDVATVTAVGNDVGFDKVFARQLIALARPGDIVVGISTSGSSPNILAALEEANRRQLLTCAITGYDGGRLRELEWLDHLFIVHGDYIPRLQEAHATIYHLLLEAIGGP